MRARSRSFAVLRMTWFIKKAAAAMAAALIFEGESAFLRGDLRALLAGFGKADGDGLFAARDFLAGASALQFSLLHFVHFGLDLLAGGGAVLAARRALLCRGLFRGRFLCRSFFRTRLLRAGLLRCCLLRCLLG